MKSEMKKNTWVRDYYYCMHPGNNWKTATLHPPVYMWSENQFIFHISDFHRPAHDGIIQKKRLDKKEEKKKTAFPFVVDM